MNETTVENMTISELYDASEKLAEEYRDIDKRVREADETSKVVSEEVVRRFKRGTPIAHAGYVYMPVAQGGTWHRHAIADITETS